jgi:hypothetical protein
MLQTHSKDVLKHKIPPAERQTVTNKIRPKVRSKHEDKIRPKGKINPADKTTQQVPHANSVALETIHRVGRTVPNNSPKVGPTISLSLATPRQATSNKRVKMHVRKPAKTRRTHNLISVLTHQMKRSSLKTTSPAAVSNKARGGDTGQQPQNNQPSRGLEQGKGDTGQQPQNNQPSRGLEQGKGDTGQQPQNNQPSRGLEQGKGDAGQQPQNNQPSRGLEQGKGDTGQQPDNTKQSRGAEEAAAKRQSDLDNDKAAQNAAEQRRTDEESQKKDNRRYCASTGAYVNGCPLESSPGGCRCYGGGQSTNEIQS